MSGWKQDGDTGRGQFKDAGYGDVNEDRKTGVELPEGYKELNIDSTVDTQSYHESGTSSKGYDGIPEQM